MVPFQGCLRRPRLSDHHHPHKAPVRLLAVQVSSKNIFLVLTISSKSGTVGNFLGLSTGCPELRILIKCSHIQTGIEFFLGKWKWRRNATLKPLLPDQNTLQMLPMQILKDSINWLVTPCSGSLQLFNSILWFWVFLTFNSTIIGCVWLVWKFLVPQRFPWVLDVQDIGKA